MIIPSCLVWVRWGGIDVDQLMSVDSTDDLHVSLISHILKLIHQAEY